jgi:DNA-binding CsgD family transcriptional regulator
MTEKPTITINFFIFSKGGPEPDPGLLQRWARLSPREQQIALLAARDLTNAQIAGKLMISTETAKTHVRNLLRKLDLAYKRELPWVLKSNGLAEGGTNELTGA